MQKTFLNYHDKNAMMAAFICSYHSYPVGMKRPQEIEDTFPVLDAAFRSLSYKDRERALQVVSKMVDMKAKLNTRGLVTALKHAENIIYRTKTMLASLFLLCMFAATMFFPVSALSPPMPGTYAPAPLTYYRVAFTSLHKKLDKTAVDALIVMADDKLSQMYIVKPHKNTDGTYEVEMRIRIIFFERKEAEKAVDYLKANPAFPEEDWVITVVQESQY